MERPFRAQWLAVLAEMHGECFNARMVEFSSPWCQGSSAHHNTNLRDKED
jgi:hypothetical protein